MGNIERSKDGGEGSRVGAVLGKTSYSHILFCVGGVR